MRRGLIASATFAMAVGAVAACTDRTPTATDKNPTALPVTLSLSPHGLTMAKNDTLTLTPTVKALDGSVIQDLSGITYVSLAPKVVTVSENGLLTAIDTSSDPVKVAAKLQRDFSTVVDTVQLIVTPTRLAPLTFVMQIDTLDGTTFGIGYSTDILPVATTPAGDTVYPIATYTTSDPKAKVNVYGSYGYFSSNTFGAVKAYATANIYGTTYTDSVTYHITYPSEAYVGWGGSSWYYPPALQVVLKPGGHVYWYNYFSDNSTDIVFDDPSKASAYQGGDSGNIPGFHGMSVYRQFNTPGTIKWTSGGQTGTIIVQPTDSPPGT